MADQVKPAVPNYGKIGPGSPYFDPFGFRLVNQPRFGNAGLRILRGSGVVNPDPGILRNPVWRELWNLQLGARAFNATNAPQFDNPGANVSSMILTPDGSIRSVSGYTELSSGACPERQ